MRSITKATLKKIGAGFAAVMLAGALLPIAAFAENLQGYDSDLAPAESTENLVEYGKGFVPIEVHVYDVPDTEGGLSTQANDEYAAGALASSYRSDTQPWAASVKVKNQGKSEMCWAASTTTTAEYSYAKETNGNAGTISETSPGHLGNFLFNRMNDPLQNTEGDANRVADGTAWPLAGANQALAMLHLSTYSGLGLESNTPFTTITSNIKKQGDKYVWEGNDPLYNTAYAYDNYITQQEGIYYERGGRDVTTGKACIKQLILKYGAVTTSLEFDDNRFMNPDEKDGNGQPYVLGHSFFNYTNTCNADHAVTVVGWDDNYAASNFTHTTDAKGDALKDSDGNPLSEDAARAATTPAGDGAWIVQNSWGTGVHEGGFFYVSYYSRDITCTNFIQAFDMQPASTYQYNFQYDGSAAPTEVGDVEGVDTVKDTKAANVYTNTTGKAITLEAVGITEYNSGNTEYEVSVYTDVTDPADPASGNLAGTTQATTTNAGCKTIELDKPVSIGAGERFSIVVAFTGKTTFGVEKAITAGPCRSEVKTAAGQSFFKGAQDTNWTDMNDKEACFRIKGLANAVSDPEQVKYTVTFVDGLGNTIDTQTVTSGSAATAPADPKRDGYTFVGWDPADFSKVTQNLVVTAQWKKDADAPGTVTAGAKVASDAPVKSAKINTAASDLLKKSAGVFTDAERARVEAGEDASVWIEVAAVKPADEAVSALLAKAAEALGGVVTVAEYVDVTLYKQVGSDEPTKVTDPKEAVSISLELRDADVPTDAASRKWCAAREHAALYSALGASYSKGAVTFASDGFSTFALAYGAKSTDTVKATSTASTTKSTTTTTTKTGDSMLPIFIVVAVAVVALAVAVLARRASGR